MKKSGFTMAELIISLTIIGVSAALVLPQIMNMAPDKYKMRVLNAYNDLYAATENILNVNRGYYIEKDEKWDEEKHTQLENFNKVCVDNDYCPDGFPDLVGLAIKDQPSGSDCKGNSKYACLLKQELGGKHITDEKFSLNDGAVIEVFPRFKTGTNYEISGHDITIYTGFGDGCTYKQYFNNDASCKHPDIFRIKVSNDGGFAPADALLDAYLRNPTNMHSKKEDFALAKELFEKNGNYGFSPNIQ